MKDSKHALMHKPIETENDYRAFVTYVVQVRKVNYHPDTDFADYLDRRGEASFFGSEVAQFNQRNHEAFKILGNNIYNVALEEFSRSVNLEGDDNLSKAVHQLEEAKGEIGGECAKDCPAFAMSGKYSEQAKKCTCGYKRIMYSIQLIETVREGLEPSATC